MKRFERTIIIIGKICSGKSTLAEKICARFGVQIASFSKYLTSYLQNIGVFDFSRRQLQDIGAQLVAENPKEFLQRVIECNTLPETVVIFEGVRHKSIFNEIVVCSSKTFCIYIDTSLEERHRRCEARDKTNLDLQDFRRIDQHPVELEIESLKGHANMIYTTSSNIEELINRINNFLTV